MARAQWQFDSKIGPLYLVASEKGLQGVFWKKQPIAFVETLKGPGEELSILSRAVEQLTEYLKGQRTEFDLPTDVQGTDFQKKVWHQLSQIPYGRTYSYSEIARRLKNDKAVRAVGTANGRNPLSIIVPCHRVIAADGSLGGYAGGLKIKTALLKIEQGS